MELGVAEYEREVYPTYDVADRVVHKGGGYNAASEMVGWTVLRAGIIAVGMFTFGVRGRNLFLGALGGSSAVSLFALFRTVSTNRKLEEAAKEINEKSREMADQATNTIEEQIAAWTR